MRKILDILGILFLIISILSCSRHYYNSNLLKAERVMDLYPDSALGILESVSLNNLKTDRDKALYGLLLTQALDKNHLSPTNDSLIKMSVNYYNSSGDKLRQTISNYYQGRVLYNANHIQSAIVKFYKAKDIAEDNGFDFWTGMACRGLSDIFNQTYNKSEELKYAKEEYNHIKKSNKQPYLNYSMHDLGRALRNNGDNTESIKLAEQLTDSAYKYQDDYLYVSALKLKAYNLTDIQQFEESYNLLLDICSNEYAETTDSLYLCFDLLGMGQLKQSEKLINTISDNNIPVKSQLRYKIAKASKNFLAALQEMEFLDSISDDEFRTSMNHNLTSSLSEYYELNKNLDEALIQNYHVKVWIITFGFIFTLLLLTVIGWCIYNNQKRKITEKILFAQQLQEDLSNSKRNNTNSMSIIKSLMSTKFELLEELCSIVLCNTDTKIARRKIADSVTKIINDFSVRSGKIVLLEEKVNSGYSNLIDDFKKDLPNLKEVDYRLFLFSVLGLSNSTISLFLKESKIEAIYNRKRRLKDKIKQLDETKSIRYLSYL